MSNPPTMPWVKLHTSYLDDVRLARLDDPQKLRFFQLLMLAGKLGAGGYFIEHDRELTEAEIAWKLRLQTETFLGDLNALANIGLTCKNGRGWCIPDFEEEQGPTQADQRAAWRERQRKHRGHSSVTSDNFVTVTDVTSLEERRGDKRREEEDVTGDNFETPTPAPTPESNQNTEDQAGDITRKVSLGEQVYQSGYMIFPENPAQAMDHPIIRRFEEVTGRIPGVSQYKTVIETILFIRKTKIKRGYSVVDYLKPYWLAWSSRKSQTGKPYSPANLTWLTEWAVNGSIPEPGAVEQSLVHPPSVKATQKRLAENANQEFVPPPQEVLAKIHSLKSNLSKKSKLSKE